MSNIRDKVEFIAAMIDAFAQRNSLNKLIAIFVVFVELISWNNTMKLFIHSILKRLFLI